ncbi:helix-turn-helix domain-containing protein [Nocardioides sp.]|uniref:helix-turn-helix domain-containing protein n=1 Tax=Nocardioides sp. TaxID=35761 RepID=UPI0039C9EA11
MGRHGRISAVRLAAASGLPYRTLARCLSGARPFAVDELEKIAAVLDCAVSDFVSPAQPPGTRTIGRKSSDSHHVSFATAA